MNKKFEELKILNEKLELYKSALKDLKQLINIWENEGRGTLASLYGIIYKMFKKEYPWNRSIHSFLNEDKELYNKIIKHLEERINQMENEFNNRIEGK